MAKIWFYFEGDRPTLGGPTAERPLAECRDLLQVTEDNYLGDDQANVCFGNPGDPLASIRGYEHVVVEVGEEEARANGWKPGYYYSPLEPANAYMQLGLGQW